MISPAISVIIPVYNVEQYLPRCIDSILAQTFTDFELLLIDDGSTDRSGGICDEYAKKDARITVFHKVNGGVSSARNVGLEHARGEWLAFVDADDWVDSDYLSLDGHEDADVVEKSYAHYGEDMVLLRSFPVSPCRYGSQEDFFRSYVNKRNNALWNKIVKRDITIGCKFDSQVRMGEDFLFFLGFIGKIRHYSYSLKGTYCYFVRGSSATGMFKDNVRERIRVLWDNIGRVGRILSASYLQGLRDGIIYATYVSYLYALRHHLTPEETMRLKGLLENMSWRKIRYVGWSVKLNLYKAKYQMIFGKQNEHIGHS